jgi:alpha-2-macroglobulin
MDTIRRVVSTFVAGLNLLRQLLGFLLGLVFGEIDWQPPAWLGLLGANLQRAYRSVQAWVRRSPRQAAGVAVFAIAVIAAVGGGVYWYQHRPLPSLLSVDVETPKAPCIECEYSRINPLKLHFSGSAAPLEKVGKVVPKGLIIEPAFAGQWRWENDQTLSFEPQQHWPIDQKYRITLLRKQVVASHVQLKAYEYTFSTVPFAAEVKTTEFYQDPEQAVDKKVVTTLHFSFPVDQAELESRIKLKLSSQLANGKTTETPITFTVLYDKFKLNAYIHSARLAVSDKASTVTVTIDKGLRAARGGNRTDTQLTASTTVPAADSLRVEAPTLEFARNDKDEPDQVMFLTTSFSVVETEMNTKVHAWLLPLRHPDAERQKSWADYNKGKPYGSWNDKEIGPEILQASEPLPLSYIANEREHVEQHGFRYRADPGRYIYVRVDKGLQSFGGYRLPETTDAIVAVPPFPQELRITNAGALLAMSGAKTLTVFSRDVPGLRVEIGRLLPDQLQHLVTQTGGDLANPQFDNYSFDASNITERVTRDIRLPKLAPGVAHYQPINFSEFLKEGSGAPGRGVFLLKVGAHQPNGDEGPDVAAVSGDGTINGLSDTRLIIVTDLGLLVKRSVTGAQDVFVQSIATGAPQAGVSIEVLGKNGDTLLKQTTDAEGHAHFADLRSFRREHEPVLYLAQRGGDSSFLPINRHVQPLDLSRFDVGGVANSADTGKLAAYLFSDRGIYRPGEEIRVGAIVKSQDWQQPLAGLPLRVEIADPRGIAIKRNTVKLSAAGFEEIRYTTLDTAPAGQYAVNVFLIRNGDPAHYNEALIGSTTVKVQEFQPDRLKMSAHLSSEVVQGWVSPQDLKAMVNLQNLFGTPAEGRRVTAEMMLTPQFPAFPAYRDFQFYDPQAAKSGVTDTLTETKTDDKGEATFDLNLRRFAKATYRLHFVAQGFEADGGRGVAAEAATLVSNLAYLVGYKADGDLRYLSRGSGHKATLIAIDPKAEKTEVKGLKLTRLEVRYVSVLIKQDNGTYRYQSRKKELMLDSQPLIIPAAGYTLPLDTGAPGSFAYVVTDAEGQQFARIDYTVAGSANLSRALDKNAELQLALSRHDYTPGEEIEMQITAPYAGGGLITIERDKVYAWKWFRADTTSSVQKIRLPEGIEGNAYVSVSFVRDPGSSEIYTSPLSYGVQPFSVNLDARRDAVNLSFADSVKPGETLKLKYKTAKPSRIVVFAVDEGILQVARYKTADPLAYFFQKRALDVSTTQILDLILPEFRNAAAGAAPGGDGEGALGRFLNPFKRKADKPVAYWSGILDADTTERELSYAVPDYFNGSLRIMAVAVAPDAVGVFDGKTLVRGDFVLSPNAPTTVTPGDTFEVSVGVSNNVDGSGPDAEIAIGLQPSSHLEVLGAAQTKLKIAEQHESVARFKVRARDELGAASLAFTAKFGGKSAKRAVSLSVRPPSPFLTQLDAGTIRDGSAEVLIKRDLYPAYRQLDAGVSVLPMSLSKGLETYLNNYGYSCTEQLVSKAVPAMVFANTPALGKTIAPKGDTLEGLVAVLRARQNSEGGFGLWAANAHVNEFVSVYAQHYLIDSAEHGQPAPRDLIDSGNRYLRTLAARSFDTLPQARNSAYAIYLLTRQGIVMANEAAALQERLENTQKAAWPQDITAAYLASAYQLMKQTGNGEKLIAKLKFSQQPQTYSPYYSGLGRDAQLLYLLARHFPSRLKALPPTALDGMVDAIKRNNYNTLSSSYVILALDAYATAAGPIEAGKLGITEVLRNGKSNALSLPQTLLPSVAFSDQTAKLKITNDGKLNAYYVVTQAGFDRKLPTAAITDGFEILHEYTDATGNLLTRVKLGQEIYVHLKYRALKPAPIYDVALVDLLPGGFELVVPASAAQAQDYTAASAGTREESESDENGEGESDEGVEVESEEEYGRAYVADWQCAICTPTSARLNYADFREDRVVFYSPVKAEIQELVYRIKAIAVGEFNVPPAYGESMYERQIRARSLGGKIIVEQP